MAGVTNHTYANNDRVVTGRQFGVGNGARLVWNLAGMDSDRALLHPVLYKIDWSGIQQLYSTARTNLCLQSQTLQTTWSGATYPVSVTPNTTVAPDGTTTADTITATAGNTAHTLTQTGIPCSAGATYTVSAYIKAGTYRYTIIGDSQDAVWHTACYDFQTGALGTATNATSSIVSLGGGWFRLSCTFVRTNAGTITAGIGLAANNIATGFSTPWNAAGTETLIAWGAQVEAGSSATPYITTTTAAVTVTDYSTAATGVVTFASAPAIGTQITYKDPYSSNGYRHFGLGDGSATTFSLPYAYVTPLIYRRGWAGNELLYSTARTNLVLRSQEFQTGWTYGGLAAGTPISADATSAPDGTTTADHINEVAGGAVHQMYQDVTTAAGVHTLSAYLKAAERSWAVLSIDGGSHFVYFDLGAGAVGTLVGTSATITAVGSGWYRCTLTYTLGAGANRQTIYTANGNGVISYSGTLNSGIYIWGAQLETGSVATPYIPTVATAVTVTDYALDSAGRGDVTFASAPAANDILTGTFNMGQQR